MRIRFRILIGIKMEGRIRISIKTTPIHNTRLMHGKKTAGSYSPVPVDGEMRGGVWQCLQVGGGAPPVLPGVQPGHAHSNLIHKVAVMAQVKWTLTTGHRLLPTFLYV
jgi:hypothetical protein